MPLTGESRQAANEGGSKLPSFVLRAVSYSSGRTGFRLKILDQRQLPGRVRHIYPKSAQDVVRAIRTLAVRGAPNIGVAAAYGMALEAQRLTARSLRTGLRSAAEALVSARPTAVNLKWAVDRVTKLVECPGLKAAGLRARIEAEARSIEAEEVVRSRDIARHGARLVPNRGRVMTICNTGALAAPGLGTALGVVFQSHLEGSEPRVFVCETRPLLQGARLTAFELARAGIAATLIVDSAAATVMPECDLVLVGADRVARNGDTANKVGTRMLAILAKEYRKSFYVVAPSSSFDSGCGRGRDIVVEERPAEEVLRMDAGAGNDRGPNPNDQSGVRVFNPAFDVTPARFITGFVTEHGMLLPSFTKSIRRALWSR